MFSRRNQIRPRVLWPVAVAAALALAIGPATTAAARGDSDQHDGRGRSDKMTDVRVRGTLTTGSPEIGICDGVVSEVPVVLDGSGVLSVLGRTTVHIDATATCGEFGLLDAITEFRGTYRAANGDRLRFVGHGSAIEFNFDAGTGAFDTSDRFTGGTGRFSHAQGHQHLAVTHSFLTNTLTLEVSATVELPRHHSDD